MGLTFTTFDVQIQTHGRISNLQIIYLIIHRQSKIIRSTESPNSYFTYLVGFHWQKCIELKSIHKIQIC